MYIYADTDGFVARGPSIRTWRAMKPQLLGRAGREFARTGHTEQPEALAKELQDAVAGTPLAALREAALAAADVLVLADGVGAEQHWLERRVKRGPA